MTSPTTKVDLANRLALFHVTTHAYKTVGNTPILVDVLIPKKLVEAATATSASEHATSPGSRRPVILRIHGGWLMYSQREYQPWISAWTLELALNIHEHGGAIIVNPDYRLLPEATMDDVLQDMDDLWKWIETDLRRVVRETTTTGTDGRKGVDVDVDVDLDRILVTGESAGGYLAVQLALSHFKPTATPTPTPTPRIRVLVPAYPMLDLRSPHFSKAYPKRILDAPQFPASLIDDFLASVHPHGSSSSSGHREAEVEVVSNTDMNDPRRMQFAIALAQHGRFLEVFDGDTNTDTGASSGKRRLHPEDRITIDGCKLPPTLFIHGADDSAVPISGTENFIQLLKEHKAVARWSSAGKRQEEEDVEDVLKLAKQPGEHGFNNDLHIDDAQWMVDAMAFVEKHWLG